MEKDILCSLFTIIIHSKTKDEILIELKNQCKKVKEISNTLKRNKILLRLDKFINYIQSQPENILNYVYYVGENIKKEPIKPTYCTEWNISSYQFMYDEVFLVDYINDLFHNKDFKHGIHVDKKLTHYIGTLHKKKIFKEYSSPSDLGQINTNFIYYGKTKPINHPKAISIINGNLKWSEVIHEHAKWEMRQIHRKLNNVLLMMENPKTSDKLIYKTEIEEAISEYKVKELYLLNDYNIDLPQDANFTINKVFVIERNDPADVLQNKLGGIIGISYY